jgi:hypothetical protein
MSATRFPNPTRDTTDEAHGAQVSVYRRMTPSCRVQLMVSMSEDARAVCRDGIRARHPDWTREQVWAEFLRLVLGDALVNAMSTRTTGARS